MKPRTHKQPTQRAMTPMRTLVYGKLDELYERAVEDDDPNPHYRSLMNEFIKFVTDVKKIIDDKVRK